MVKKTFKIEQKKENKKYHQSVLKCRKMKDKTEKERKKKSKCYLPIDKKRFADLQYLKKKYPDEWSEFEKTSGGGGYRFHEATILEGSWLYDWNPYKNKRSSKRTKRNNNRGGALRGKSKKNQYISNDTLKSLQKLSYHDLRNLSSTELQKYKKRVSIVDQEGNPFTDEDLIHMLRKYISGNKMKTKQLTWRAQQHEKIKQRLLGKYQKGGKQKKKTFKSEKKKENIDYWKCVKQNENTQKCNTKRSKTLKYLEKKYPKEWSQYQIDFQMNPKLRY